MEEYKFPPWAIWNADEKPICVTNRGSSVYTFVDKLEKEIVVESAGIHRHYTLLAATSAAGDTAMPTVLLPLKNDPSEEEPFIGQMEFICTSSGYINKPALVKWATIVLIPKLDALRSAHNATNAPVLLVMDNHSSRCNLEFVKLLFDHHIVLFMLPSNSSFVLQPLDLNYNNTFQTFFNKQFPALPPGFSMEQERRAVFSAILSAARSASTPETVKAGFKRSGIWGAEGKPDMAEPLSSPCVVSGPYEPSKPLPGGQPDTRAKVITTENFLQELKKWES